MKYLLTAKWSDIVRTKTLHAKDDAEAIACGALLVVGEAFADPVWARGSIKLTAPDGSLVKSMEPK